METPKKEWKWPMGIFVAYVLFVVATLGFVAFTFTIHFDLVAPNYYEKTLAYQQHIDSEANALALEHPLEWKIASGEILVQYPSELIETGLEGTVVLYRPSDASLDRSFPVAADNAGLQRISSLDLKRGLWEMQVQWTSAGKSYYAKSDLFLP